MVREIIRNIFRTLISVSGFLLEYLVRKPEGIQKHDRIAILLWGGIGNHVLFSPALSGIRERFPDAQISICSFHSFARQMFSKTANSFITINENPSLKALLRLLFYVRMYKPDIVLSNVMSPTFLTSLIAFLSGAKLRIAMNRGYRGFLNNVRIDEKNAHEVLENIRILRTLGVYAKRPVLSIDISEEDKEIAEKMFKDLQSNNIDSPIVAIQPGSGKKQSYKRWDREKFKELTENLLGMDFDVVIIGTEEEKEEVEYIERSIRHKRLKVLKKRLTLPQITKFLCNFDLIIANDTSLVHLGAVSGTPSVVIYGPTDPKKNRPWGVDFRIVRKELDCSPCYNFRTPNCHKGFRCLNDITVEDVLHEIKALLDI